MKRKWKLMCDLMRIDLITMRGGKNNNRSIAIVAWLFFLTAGYFISPIAAVYVPFLMGAVFVTTLFQNELKYHSDKLWGLLPVSRRDIVNARFLLSVGLFTIVCIVTYLLMLLAMPLQAWRLLMEDGDDTEILTMVAERSGLSPMGMFNLAFFGACAFGLFCMTQTLRKYFRDPNAFSSALAFGNFKKSSKKEITAGVVIAGLVALWLLIIEGLIPVGPVVSLAAGFCMQLAQAADGFLLAAVFLTMSVMHSVYYYVCTVIEYEQADL